MHLILSNGSWKAFIFGDDEQIVLACNTAHVFIDQLESFCSHKFVSLILAAIENIATESRTVGILASPTTIRTKLYSKELHSTNRVVVPDHNEMAVLEDLIRSVIAGNNNDRQKETLRHCINRMKRAGCDQVILGCTELSVIGADFNDPSLIDPLQLVAHKLVNVDDNTASTRNRIKL